MSTQGVKVTGKKGPTKKIKKEIFRDRNLKTPSSLLDWDFVYFVTPEVCDGKKISFDHIKMVKSTLRDQIDIKNIGET